MKLIVALLLSPGFCHMVPLAADFTKCLEDLSNVLRSIVCNHRSCFLADSVGLK